MHTSRKLHILSITALTLMFNCFGARGIGVEAMIQGDGIYQSSRNCTLDLRFSPADFSEAGKHRVEVAWVRDLSLMYERDTVIFQTRRIKLPENGSVTRSFRFKLEPGFYQVCVSVDGKPVEVNLRGKAMNSFNIGVDPEKIVSQQTRQNDFDAFWESTLRELGTVPMEASLTLMPERSDEHRNVYRVEMKSFGGETIGGILAEPVAAGSYPVFIEYMGYGADVYPYWGGNNPDRIEFLVSVRSQGIFRDCKSGENGKWITRGLNDKNEFYYRGAFCDVVRAIDFVCSREKADQANIYALGESQGGAFTWISASLDSRIRAISVAVPFLSDYEDYQKIVWWPMWEVFEAADSQGIDREELMKMLSYFDIKNFTDKITCPVYMAFGLQDPTCPPHTNFAGYNNVRTEKHFHCVPTCGHEMWLEQSWKDIKEEWFSSMIAGSSL